MRTVERTTQNLADLRALVARYNNQQGALRRDEDTMRLLSVRRMFQGSD